MVAFGMQLPIQSQSTIFVQPWEPSAGAAELVQVTQACEAAGLRLRRRVRPRGDPGRPGRGDEHRVVGHDRHARRTWPRSPSGSGCSATSTCCPYRHPLVAAKAWATLDALSGGRAILGVGAGHVEGEFDGPRGALRRPGPAARRGHRRRPRPPSPTSSPRHDGPRWRFEGLGQRPRPVQAALPIWVGGSSKPAMRRAAERGDGWLPAGPARGRHGRRHRLHPRRTAPRRAATTRSCSARCPARSTSATRRGTRPAACAVRPTRSPRYLRTYADLGVDQIQVGFVSRSADELCDQIAAFAADVAPLVND